MANIVDWPDDLTLRLAKFTKENPVNYPHARVVMIEATAKFIGVPESTYKQWVSRARTQARNNKADKARQARTITKDLDMLRKVRQQLANGQPITDIAALKAALGLDDDD